MKENVFISEEPVLIAHFNATKAQEFANQYSFLEDCTKGFVKFELEETQRQLVEFELEAVGDNDSSVVEFICLARSKVEHVARYDDSLPTGTRHWHQDIDEGKGYQAVNFQFGSSSHDIDIVAGAVRFSKPFYLPNECDLGYLGSDDGKTDIAEALDSGDAWIYDFPDEDGAGFVIESVSRNIHRQSIKKSTHPLRYSVRGLKSF